MAEDPLEKKDSTAENPAMAASLRDVLSAHQEACIVARQNRSRRSVTVDAETARQQELLGYTPKTKGSDRK